MTSSDGDPGSASAPRWSGRAGRYGIARRSCSRAPTSTRCRRAGAVALMLPPDAWVADAPGRRAGRPGRAGAGRRGGHRPRLLRRRAPPEDDQHPPRPRPRRDRPGAARAGARPARARDLPRDAADQRRARRDAGPAPARRRRPHRPPPRARAPSTTPTTTCAWRRARWRRAACGEIRARDEVPPSPGGRRAGRGRRGVAAGACSTTSSRRSSCPTRAGRWASSGTRRSTRARASCASFAAEAARRPRRVARAPRHAASRRRRDAPGTPIAPVTGRLPVPGPSARLDIFARVRAPLDRHPRGRLHGARRRPRGAVAPPPAPPQAARRDRRRRSDALRPGALFPRSRARDVGMCALQMYAYLATYQMPNDDPEKLMARVRVEYPVKADRLIGRGTTPTLRLQRALGDPGRFRRWEKVAGVVALGLVRVPARDGRLRAAQAPRPVPARRGADLRDVRPRRDRLLGDPDRAAVVRGAAAA